MTGFLIAFWAAPTMSVGHLLLALVTNGYFIIAVLRLEEKDLVAETDDDQKGLSVTAVHVGGEEDKMSAPLLERSRPILEAADKLGKGNPVLDVKAYFLTKHGGTTDQYKGGQIQPMASSRNTPSAT